MTTAVAIRKQGQRSDTQVFVLVGVTTGGGGAIVLPVLWVILSATFGGLGGSGVVEWVLITLVYAIPAAILFAGLGAIAGASSAAVWRRRSQWQIHRSRRLVVLLPALILGLPVGAGLGYFFSSAIFGLVLGLLTALLAGATSAVTLARIGKRSPELPQLERI